jgi:transposase
MSEIEAEKIAVWVGLDWADEEHVYALQRAGSARIETGTVQQRPEDLRAWINGLREGAGEGWVAVAVEQSRGALIYALMDYEFVLIYPVHPKALAKYREAIYPSGAKDDARDADLILDYVLKHRDRLRLWRPESPGVRCLRMLSEERRKLVDLRTELTNRLTASLKNYFPQALAWAGALKEAMGCDFLERWPSLARLQGAKRAVVRRFFRSHGVRADAQLEAKLDEIARAQPLTKDWAITTAGLMLTESLVRQIRELNASIESFDEKIKEVFEGHDDHAIFASLPGCGAALGPRLLALFGEDRERFDSARQVQAMSGIAPLVRASGQSRVVHFRWACAKFVRQGAHEFAHHSRHWCPWAQAFYKMQVSKGKRHHTAVRALAFKWLRILFRCWKDGVPYDDDLYMASLKANNAPLLAYRE